MPSSSTSANRTRRRTHNRLRSWQETMERSPRDSLKASQEESMSTLAQTNNAAEAPYVSTGHLPSPDVVRTLVAEAHQRYRSNTDGQNSQVYPALARVPSHLFGICVVGTSGNIHAAGDAEHEFSIMSVSKPFVFALICQVLGPEEARQKLGVNATGLAFNSLAAVEQSADG